jgi:chemotaxis protein methyltransferase CheR
LESGDFKFFEDLLRRESGLIITPDKVYLLESRLLPLIQKNGIATLADLVQKLRLVQAPQLAAQIVEAMTTNETSFFRDNTPFQRLREDVLPLMIKRRSQQKSLRIWSAACSSGQEPYSRAMLLREQPALAGWKLDILATDLSHQILAQAQEGTYSQFEIQRGLPVQMLVKYFLQKGDKWSLKPEVREMVRFQIANLLTDIPTLGIFDIIFCRNVLIYFDLPTKTRVLGIMKNALKQDGALFLGGAETVIGVTENFRPMPRAQGVYVRNDTSLLAEAAPAVSVPVQAITTAKGAGT